MQEQKQFLSKWLRILLYVHTAAMAITVINAVSYLDNVTGWVSKALLAVGAWSLMQLRIANPRYQTAAIAKIALLICGLLTAPITSSAMSPSIVLVLIGSTASWIASYQEYHAHGELVAKQDEKLAKKWSRLFWVEVLVGLGISLFTTAATVVLVSAEMDSQTVTTIILAVTNLLYLLLDALYLLYMRQTLTLPEIEA